MDIRIRWGCMSTSRLRGVFPVKHSSPYALRTHLLGDSVGSVWASDLKEVRAKDEEVAGECKEPLGCQPANQLPGLRRNMLTLPPEIMEVDRGFLKRT